MIEGAGVAVSSLPIVIVGSGFSGIAMAVYLKQRGIESFVIFEKGDGVGGTWRDNTYPGAACDVPSHLYSFSFEPNPSWSRAFSPQAEIRAYLEHCAQKYDVLRHIRFGARVERAVYDDATGAWTVHVAGAEPVRARALVLGNGALHIPAYPTLAGLETFEGKAFHSARWDHGYDLTHKRVAVIGTGASAIQFVPQIAPKVAQLHLFQRTAPWVIPKPDHAIAPATRAAFAKVPALQRAARAAIYCRLEAQALAFTVNPDIMKLGELVARRYLRAQVRDPALRRALTPDYRMGCKRVLLSNDYYPALTRPNVEVVTAGIERVGPRSIRTRDGVEREVDAILYGTGFKVSEYLAPIEIRGANGRDLSATWQATPEAYLGITVAGFPNLFLLMGPNTGLGHNSMVFMIEAQARYTAQCIEALRDLRLASIEVRRDAQAAFNVWLQKRLEGTVWQSGCKSWYLSDSGRNSTLWPGFTWDYWRRTRTVQLSDYVMERAPA